MCVCVCACVCVCVFEAEGIIDSLDLAVRQRQKIVSFRVGEVARVGFSRGG